MIEFKTLQADDIEVRVQQVTEKGCSLLLYKDARCDMRMLDEAVGNENWDCEYQSINGNLFCTVGIRCELPNGETSWVYKQDVGTKSNMEPDKGEASDAFKRACFKWGIGRELYTAPFVWVPRESLQKHHQDNGRWKCNDRFKVRSVKVEGGRIADLEIENQHGLLVYQMRSKGGKPANVEKGAAKDCNGAQRATEGRFARIRELKAEAMSLGISEDGIESWISTTFKGKPKKELDGNEIKMTEAYLVGVIRDKKALNG